MMETVYHWMQTLPEVTVMITSKHCKTDVQFVSKSWKMEMTFAAHKIGIAHTSSIRSVVSSGS